MLLKLIFCRRDFFFFFHINFAIILDAISSKTNNHAIIPIMIPNVIFLSFKIKISKYQSFLQTIYYLRFSKSQISAYFNSTSEFLIVHLILCRSNSSSIFTDHICILLSFVSIHHNSKTPPSR